MRQDMTGAASVMLSAGAERREVEGEAGTQLQVSLPQYCSAAILSSSVILLELYDNFMSLY